MALAQQDNVDVDVSMSMCVTQVELQHISSVAIQSAHQGAIRAQLLERSCGLSSPAALQQANHNTLIHKTHFVTSAAAKSLDLFT